MSGPAPSEFGGAAVIPVDGDAAGCRATETPEGWARASVQPESRSRAPTRPSPVRAILNKDLANVRDFPVGRARWSERMLVRDRMAVRLILPPNLARLPPSGERAWS